jgi:hypothetical protein
MLLNCCLIIDLYFMMSMPFVDKSKYMTIYIFVSFFGASCLSILLQFTNFSWWIILFIFFYALIGGVSSIIYAYCKLSKPGISSSIRSLILRRHTLGIVVFFISNLYVFFYGILKVFNIPFTEYTAPRW